MEKVLSLDPLDRRIVRVLQHYGDISNADLAERVASSPAAVWRRAKAMEAAGVLGAHVRLVNRKAIGKNLDVLCQVRMKLHDRDARAQFEAFVATHEAVMECYSMSGEWDYLLRVVATDVEDYEAFLMRELLSHAAVATSASHFALHRVKYTTALPL